MNIPDYMPVLSFGVHSDPKQGACVMEMASFLSGETWSDQPECVHSVIAAASRTVNDKLKDSKRQELLDLLPRLMATGRSHDAPWLNERLALWAAKQYHKYSERHVRDGYYEKTEEMLTLVEKYLDEPTKENLIAAESFSYTSGPVDNMVANLLNLIYRLLERDIKDDTYASVTVYDTVRFLNRWKPSKLVQFLTEMLDEFDRLVGKSETVEVTEADLRRVKEYISA